MCKIYLDQEFEKFWTKIKNGENFAFMRNADGERSIMLGESVAAQEENLKINYPYTVVNVNSAEKGAFDIELMKNCKHNIIANSSFSWWGAWLNENQSKIVIAPNKWFFDGKKTDIICEDWIKI